MPPRAAPLPPRAAPQGYPIDSELPQSPQHCPIVLPQPSTLPISPPSRAVHPPVVCSAPSLAPSPRGALSIPACGMHPSQRAGPSCRAIPTPCCCPKVNALPIAPSHPPLSQDPELLLGPTNVKMGQAANGPHMTPTAPPASSLQRSGCWEGEDLGSGPRRGGGGCPAASAHCSPSPGAAGPSPREGWHCPTCPCCSPAYHLQPKC